VVALAYNYKDLVGERSQYDEPLLFLKLPTSVIGSQSPIVIPSVVSRVWVEVELAFVVKKDAWHVKPESAAEYVLGYTIANDVTASNIHGRDWHLARSKALDTFCPVGSVLYTDTVTSDLCMSTRINGRVTQRGSTANRILNDTEALSLISQFVTLHPGDLILTGTPAGAMDSLIHPGDEVVLEIEGIGRLTNPVIADQREEE
jgi:2-keto-4-pentenoate hydratase/2-oxohepta-3-ene-1,7-dioic acid hydratase in catechol pathway